MAENGAPKYQMVAARSFILVRVPTYSENMRQLGECKFVKNGETVKIPPRWMHGMPFGKIILNRNFYGLSPNNLGEDIVARVEVKEKTLPDGRKFTMLDIHKMPKGNPANHRLKIKNDVGGFPVIGTQKFVHFVPLDLCG